MCCAYACNIHRHSHQPHYTYLKHPPTTSAQRGCRCRTRTVTHAWVNTPATSHEHTRSLARFSLSLYLSLTHTRTFTHIPIYLKHPPTTTAQRGCLCRTRTTPPAWVSMRVQLGKRKWLCVRDRSLTQAHPYLLCVCMGCVCVCVCLCVCVCVWVGVCVFVV